MDEKQGPPAIIDLEDRQDSRSETKSTSHEMTSTVEGSSNPPVEYKLYKRRFAGCLGLAILNGICAMSWPWFGPISNNMAADFGITLDQINWMGNIISCAYLPVALLVPFGCSRYGIRRCCEFAGVILILSSWIRFAGTSRALSVNGAYALLMVGQLLSSISSAVFQVLVPKYSENWFGLKGRTTATMAMSISYPIGGAIGQLLSPIVGDSRRSILVLGIISTAVVPAVFLIGSAPPTPPTYAGSQESPSLWSLVRAMLGKKTSSNEQMTLRERIDFAILFTSFSILVAVLANFAILTAQVLGPVGYSAAFSGILGAVMLLAGIIAAIITAPLFDRVLTYHLAITIKVLVPMVSAAWLSLIWAVKPHNPGGLLAIMIVIGIGSITLLPIALELGCELTRNANGSSAILWSGGNLFGIVFLLVEGALRAGPNANPPLNMRRTLIFNGATAMFCAPLVLLIQGWQVRKALDEQKIQAQQQHVDLEKSNAPSHTTESLKKVRTPA